VAAKGKFGSNPNLLFIFSFYLCFPNLIIRFGTNPNLTRVEKFIYIIFLFQLFKYIFSVFIQVEGFHPSMIFNGPYLPHTSSDFGDSCVIGFVLASSMQQ
jgi:hypothetical protein